MWSAIFAFFILIILLINIGYNIKDLGFGYVITAIVTLIVMAWHIFGTQMTLSEFKDIKQRLENLEGGSSSSSEAKTK